MSNNGFFICFTGIDGSGKTTNSKNFVESLKKEGHDCQYVYGRLNPFFIKPLIWISRMLFLRKENMFEDYSAYSKKKKKSMQKYGWITNIYYKIMLIDYLLQIFIKFNIPMLFGKNLVCDRYIFDTIIIDMGVDREYSISKIQKSLEKTFKIIPKPDIIFLIDVDEEIAFSRKDDIPAIDYLKNIRNTYLELAEKENMIILDGNNDLNRINSALLTHFNKWWNNERF